MPLIPFYLTFIEYESADRFGFFFALLSSAPIFLLVAQASLFLSRRDLGTLALILGQLLNELLNSILKRTIREPRPPHASSYADGSFGMPSSHAQFSFFLASYAALWAASGRWRAGRAWALLVACAAPIGAALIAYSRVRLNYHTPAQVLAGAAVGCGAGALWFFAVERLLRPFFGALVAQPLARWLWLRDGSSVHVLAEEYAAVAAAAAVAAKRERKSRRA